MLVLNAEQGKVKLLITTTNVMDFVFDITFEKNTGAPSELTIKTVEHVASIPPYGLWEPLNEISYANGLLAMPYLNKQEHISFLAIFNLNVKTSPETPLAMLGGIYEDVDEAHEELITFQILTPIENATNHTFAPT